MRCGGKGTQCVRCQTLGILCLYSVMPSNRDSHSPRVRRVAASSKELSRQRRKTAIDHRVSHGVDRCVGGFDDTESSLELHCQKVIQDQSRHTHPQRQKPPQHHRHQLPLPPFFNNANRRHSQPQKDATTASDDGGLPGPDDIMVDPKVLTVFHPPSGGHGGLDFDELLRAPDPCANSLFPGFLLPSPDFSTESPGQESSQRGPSCNCLGVIVTLLEDLESLPLSQIAYAALDTALASHKLCLSQVDQVVRCENCVARSELMALLTHVCEQLTRLCERLVAVFLHAGSLASPPSGLASLPTPAESVSDSGLSQQLSSSTRKILDSATLPFHCGSYNAAPSEWKCVIRLLISLQVRALFAVLGRLRETSFSTRLELIHTKIRVVINRLESSSEGSFQD